MFSPVSYGKKIKKVIIFNNSFLNLQGLFTKYDKKGIIDFEYSVVNKNIFILKDFIFITCFPTDTISFIFFIIIYNNIFKIV